MYIVLMLISSPRSLAEPHHSNTQAEEPFAQKVGRGKQDKEQSIDFLTLPG